MLLVSYCSCLYPIRWSQVLSWEWGCSWSSADRRCSNYIWVINNLITYWSASYIRDLTVTCVVKIGPWWAIVGCYHHRYHHDRRRASIPSSLPSAPNLYATNLAFFLFNFSHRRRKLDISKYPRHKVILFQFPRCPHAPSLSPFALKLETYLRMANIPYQVRVDILSLLEHYCDVKMGAMASQITSLTIVYSAVYSGADQRKYQSSASLAFVRGIHRWPVNSPHKRPATRKMFPFDDVIIWDRNTTVSL